MELRAAYCLNAFFKRQNPNRLLRTDLTRIETSRQIRTVTTPDNAADVLERTTDFPVTFVMEGAVHDCYKCTDSTADVLRLTFEGRLESSRATVNEDFLKGLIHYDALPRLHGPDMVAFIAILRRAGGVWQNVDFMEHCQRSHAA